MRFIEVCLENRKENSGGESMLKLLRYSFREAKMVYALEFIILFFIDIIILATGLYLKSKGTVIIDIHFYEKIVSMLAYVNALIIMNYYQRQLTKSVGALYFSTKIKGKSYLLSKVVEYCIIQGSTILFQSIFSYIYNFIILSERISITQGILIYTLQSVNMFDIILFLMMVFILLDSKVQDYKASSVSSILVLGFAGIAGLIVNHNLVKLLPQFVMNINMPFYSKESYLNIFLGAFVRDGVLNINLLTLFIKLGLYIALIFIAGRAMDKKLNMSFNG